MNRRVITHSLILAFSVSAVVFSESPTVEFSTFAHQALPGPLQTETGMSTHVRSSNVRLRFEAIESRLAGLGLSVAPLPLARYKSDDPRWGLTQIGVATMDWTACVPAAFASLLSAHGINRNPVHVAAIMHETGDYNRELAGAGGYSIVQAAKQFDLTATPLRSEDALKDALRKNHAVIALLAGPDTLALPETTHAVALSGLNDGHTFAVNPGVFDDAWFSVSELWENRSTLELDQHEGAVFWAIR